MRKSQKALKILFADDHQIVREGFIRLIDKEEGLEIVAEAENGLEAIQLAAELSPDLTILDLRMPKMDGATAAAEIAATIAEQHLAPSLSERQKDILRLVAKGFNNDEIAEQIGITRHGVKAHLAIAFERLGASSRAEATSLALSLGII